MKDIDVNTSIRVLKTIPFKLHKLHSTQLKETSLKLGPPSLPQRGVNLSHPIPNTIRCKPPPFPTTIYKPPSRFPKKKEKKRELDPVN